MNRCRTVQSMFSEDSGCLVEKPDCGFAHRFGFSFVCRHPDHAKFRVHTTGLLQKEEALELYKKLRQKRRDKLLLFLEEMGWKNFFLQTDYFGHPLHESTG